MTDITGANAVVTLQIFPLFPIPQQLQGFAADDVYDIALIDSVEVLMGVDGNLSGGFVFKQIEQDIALQADSASNSIFDTWWQQMVASTTVYTAQGVVSIPSIGLKFVQTNGFLTGYKLPGVKKIVQPRRYRITWNNIFTQPV
jgi:hypothetical protein